MARIALLLLCVSCSLVEGYRKKRSATLGEQNVLDSAQNVSASAPVRMSQCTAEQVSLRVRVLVTASEFAGHQHRERVEAIKDTWGRASTYRLSDGRCASWDIIFANEGSAYTEAHGALPSLPDELVPPLVIQKQGRAMGLLSNILHEFNRDPSPDLIFKVDDCVFVIPENAVKLLGGFSVEKPLLLGGHLRTAPEPRGQLFASASGFALNRAALTKIDVAWRDKPSFDKITSLVGRSPDVGLAAMCQQFGFEMPSTRHGYAERFNVFPPMASLTGTYHDWFVNYKQNAGQNVSKGLECCASDSVFFHYVSGSDIRFLQRLIRGPWFNVTTAAERLAAWPRESLFDTWSPNLRPSATSGDPFWKLIESIRACC